MTVGVYGLVACIVKLDDAGLLLSRQRSAFARRLGRGLLAFAPWLMKALSVVGTAAMFLVGGSILGHGVAPLHRMVEAASQGAGPFGWLVALLVDALTGVVAGALGLAAVKLAGQLRSRRAG